MTMRWLIPLALALCVLPAAAGGQAPARLSRQGQNRFEKFEAHLARQQLNLALFLDLTVWTAQSNKWISTKVKEEPGRSARVRIVHLWAEYCEPCLREFIWLRRVIAGAAERHQGRVAYVLVAETLNDSGLQEYLSTNKAQMPPVPYYQDAKLQLLAELRRGLPDGSVGLPTTLLIDSRGTIRKAFIGSLTEPVDRRSEFLDVIEQLASVP